MKALRLLFAAFLTFALPRTAHARDEAWTNQGFSDGTIRALAVDPADPLVVYASVLAEIGKTGGTFKSVDGAGNWIRIDDSETAFLVVDPIEPRTVYAGEDGVRKSLDAGSTWVSINEGLSCRFVRAFALDPKRPSTLLAGTGNVSHSPDQCGGLFQSMNAGSMWGEVLGWLIQSIAVNPLNSQNVLAIQNGAGGGSSELIRTVDGGASWTFIAPGPPDPIFIVADPAGASRFYVGSRGVWLSQDGGETWQSLGLTEFVVTALAIDPTNPAILYAGTQSNGVWRSLDGGRSWTDFNIGLSNVFVNALAVNTTGTRLYAGTRGGGVFATELPAHRAILARNPRTTRELPPRP